jgi:hypothetical protein
METKVPFYSITNIFLPGLIFIGSCIFLFFGEVEILVKTVNDLGNIGLEVLITVSLFAIAYEIGYIIFRIGAVGIERLLKKLFGWADYKDYISAGKTSNNAFEKLEKLSREYGYVRTRIALFTVLAILTGIKAQWWIMGSCILCVVLFLFTARGHMKKIQGAVSQYLTTSNGSEARSDG